MNEKQEQMVISNRGLVGYIVGKLNIPQDDYDDVFSVGMQGLIKAAKTFEEKKGTKFSTYASRCINNEIFMYYRKEKKHDNQVSLESTITTDIEGNEFTFADILYDPKGDFEQQIEIEDTFIDIINFIMNALNSSEKIAMLYKVAGFTEREIGKILKITQSYVSRIIKNAKQKIKQYLREYEQNTPKKYNQVFYMTKENNSYKIKFFSTNVKNFDESFLTFTGRVDSYKDLIKYQISCNKEEVIISIPNTIEIFLFIAMLMEDMKIELVKMHKTVSKRKGSNTELVRSYILSVDSFTLKELRDKFTFPKANNAIMSAITDCKNKGLIISAGRGKYFVQKK